MSTCTVITLVATFAAFTFVASIIIAWAASE